jgi:beta-lactamase superfamily II metal-dependent hydrolase
MSIIKSLSVGEGDMFYIKHDIDSFTIIDCCLSDENKVAIAAEVKAIAGTRGVTRFISTHPDDDHIAGLQHLDAVIGIANFYCVKNEATKEDETDDFKRYCQLRDSAEKAFYLSKGCSRKWLNQDDDTRGSAGIRVYWPDTANEEFAEALAQAEAGESPNNISPIITYSVKDGVTAMWMGDLETEFMKSIADKLKLPRADILFAPHHGRDTGKVPEELLRAMDPKIIVIGEAPSEDLNYYAGYNTITQNSAGDIIFDCDGKKVHVYVSEHDYSLDFLDDERMTAFKYYVGTLNL